MFLRLNRLGAHGNALQLERDLGQPEVENLGVPALGDKNIGRLDVAMNDPLGVRGVERVGNLNGEREDQLSFHRSAGNPMLQRLPVQKLHGDVRLLATLADVVNGADVGMAESGGGT